MPVDIYVVSEEDIIAIMCKYKYGFLYGSTHKPAKDFLFSIIGKYATNFRYVSIFSST